MASATCAISLGYRAATAAAKGGRSQVDIFVGARVTSVKVANAAEISGTGPSNLKAWLPPQRTPIAYVDINGQQTPVYIDASTWYRFLQYVAEIKLGGVNGPTLANVAADVVTAKSEASAAAIGQASIGQQVQANAQALAVTVEVAQTNSLAGADQIPPVSLRSILYGSVIP